MHPRMAWLAFGSIFAGLAAGCSSGGDGSGASAADVTFNCAEVTSNRSSAIGTNLITASYFGDAHWMFVDIFTKSSGWLADSPSLGFGNGTIVSQDAEGWPTGVVADTRPVVQLLSGIDGRFPIGTYVIHWEGSGGTLFVDEDAGNLRCEDGGAISACPSRRGFFEVNLASATGIFLGVTPDDPASYGAGNYIRNIRVIMPGGICGRSPSDLDSFEYCQSSRGGQGGCDAGETCFDFDDVHFDRFNDNLVDLHNPGILFHPSSIRGLRKYRSVRYMEWMRMQTTGVVNWADRTRMGATSWALNDGPPPELTVALSNLLHVQPWLNIPHAASNDYVDSYATYASQNLDVNLEMYLEYSNEHWNPSADFPQSDYMLAQAVAGSIGVGETDLVRQNMFYATRSVEIFDRWFAAWTGDDARVIRVLGGWSGMPEVGNTLLSQPGVAAKTDAIAVGDYIGVYVAFAEHESVVETWAVDDLFNEIFVGGLDPIEAPSGALRQTTDAVDAYVQIAATHGVDLVGYESGSHLWGPDTESNAAIQAVFHAAALDPRMGRAYRELYDHWRGTGAKLISNFAYMFREISSFGTLPHEFAACEDYPKAGALNQWIIENPCWWTGCEIAP